MIAKEGVNGGGESPAQVERKKNPSFALTEDEKTILSFENENGDFRHVHSYFHKEFGTLIEKDNNFFNYESRNMPFILMLRSRGLITECLEYVTDKILEKEKLNKWQRHGTFFSWVVRQSYLKE